jgi:hypothetical protein
MTATTKEHLRMLQWVFIAFLFYGAALIFKGYGVEPELQIVSMKLGHITIAAFVGYWIDRTAFRTRITASSHPLESVRRAIIIASAMLAIALGL